MAGVDTQTRANARAYRIKSLRWIVEHHQATSIDGELVDAFSASAAVQIHDALTPENRVKLLDLSIIRMFDLVWKLAKTCS